MTRPDLRLVGIKDLKSLGVSYSRAHIHRRIKEGTFPKPVHLGEKRIAFVVAEIEAWIAARIAERDAASAGR